MTGGSVADWLACEPIGTEGPGFKLHSRCCRVAVLNKMLTLIVHQVAKLVAALLRVAGVTAGLAESNGSLLPRL